MERKFELLKNVLRETLAYNSAGKRKFERAATNYLHELAKRLD